MGSTVQTTSGAHHVQKLPATFPGNKVVRAWRLAPRNTEITNARSCTTSIPGCLHAVVRDELTFNLTWFTKGSYCERVCSASRLVATNRFTIRGFRSSLCTVLSQDSLKLNEIACVPEERPSFSCRVAMKLKCVSPSEYSFFDCTASWCTLPQSKKTENVVTCPHGLRKPNLKAACYLHLAHTSISF